MKDRVILDRYVIYHRAVKGKFMLQECVIHILHINNYVLLNEQFYLLHGEVGTPRCSLSTLLLLALAPLFPCSAGAADLE